MGTRTRSGVKLVLASRSPRRARMLREAGYVFEQVDPPFDDPPQPAPAAGAAGASPADLAMDLAMQKAMSLRHSLAGLADQAGGAVILAADTICVDAQGRLIGQPQDREAALRILQRFNQSEHEVVTGVALVPADEGSEPVVFADTARVRWGCLSDEAIQAYLDTGQWRGKAGGYNLEERQQAGWPIEVKGDPATVVGLPMQALRPRLAMLGIKPEGDAGP